MAWTTPRTWVTGEVVTASIMNTHIRDNLRYIKGLDGAVQIDDNIVFPGAQTVDGTDISAHVADADAHFTHKSFLSGWTADKLLKGAGAGNDPTEIDVPSAVTFTEYYAQDSHTVSTASTWEDWDLSAIVGAGAIAVLVSIEAHTNSQMAVGARKNGAADARYSYVASPFASTWITCCNLLTECDANRIIEIFAASTSDVRFQIRGYWS